MFVWVLRYVKLFLFHRPQLCLKFVCSLALLLYLFPGKRWQEDYSFSHLHVSTYFYRMNQVPKDWRHVLVILALNITILRSTVQLFRSFLTDSTPFSWTRCTQPLSNWPVGTPQSQHIVSALEVQFFLKKKYMHASRKIFWSRFIVTNIWLFN